MKELNVDKKIGKLTPKLTENSLTPMLKLK